MNIPLLSHANEQGSSGRRRAKNVQEIRRRPAGGSRLARHPRGFSSGLEGDSGRARSSNCAGLRRLSCDSARWHGGRYPIVLPATLVVFRLRMDSLAGWLGVVVLLTAKRLSLLPEGWQTFLLHAARRPTTASHLRPSDLRKSPSGKVLVIIPTYNEASGIRQYSRQNAHCRSCVGNGRRR